MPKVTPQLFEVLHDRKVEAALTRLYKEALKQSWSMVLHFLPKAFRFFGKGIDWKTEDETFYDDKYTPILPYQGTFLYMQARALQAKNILEFGTSFGISTIYLAKAAKDNGGRVISTEYLPNKVKIARQNLIEAGVADYVEVLEGDAQITLKDLDIEWDFVLLDGWPDMVYTIFKLIEPKLKKGAVIVVDDVQGFQPSMKDYFDYVRSPENGYLSTTVYPKKAMEFTIKL